MFNFFKISQGIKDLAKQMIENPEDWIQDDHYFINKRYCDISIWTANGASSLSFKGNEGLNWAEKIYLNNAIKQSIANKVLKIKAIQK